MFLVLRHMLVLGLCQTPYPMALVPVVSCLPFFSRAATQYGLSMEDMLIIQEVRVVGSKAVSVCFWPIH